MRALRLTVGRLVVLTAVLVHWLGVAPSYAALHAISFPGLERIDPEFIAVGHLPVAVVPIKRVLVERASHSPSADAALLPGIGQVDGEAPCRPEYGISPRTVSVFVRSYRARAPPVV